MVEYFGPRDLVLDGQSLSGDTDQSSTDLANVNKEGILKRGSGARGVLPITKQHFNLNDG